MQANGQDARPLTNAPNYTYMNFAWSPPRLASAAGAWIACVRFNQASPTATLELWAIDSLTGRGLMLVEGGYAPRWLP